MPRGGRRAGAGRKPGSKDKAPRVRRYFAMPPQGALARDIASAIVDRRLPEVEAAVFDSGSVANQLEFLKLMLGFSWGLPRAAVDLRVEQAETPERVLRRLAERRFGKPEIVAATSDPPLLLAEKTNMPSAEGGGPAEPAAASPEALPLVWSDPIRTGRLTGETGQ